MDKYMFRFVSNFVFSFDSIVERFRFRRRSELVPSMINFTFCKEVHWIVSTQYHISLTEGTNCKLPSCGIIMRNTTNKYIHIYVNLLYYKQRSLLHVSATYCDHFQGGVI